LTPRIALQLVDQSVFRIVNNGSITSPLLSAPSLPKSPESFESRFDCRSILFRMMFKFLIGLIQWYFIQISAFY
jgi:hypothetical protein